VGVVERDPAPEPDGVGVLEWREERSEEEDSLSSGESACCWAMQRNQSITRHCLVATRVQILRGGLDHGQWSFALDLLLPSFHDMTTVVHKCDVRENNAQ
jgi:hypothetical protein